ncbi:MAG: polymerase, sigma-24 subunit, subfamily [Myxococcaceae bacterium]|nr:polymerase, sigma-24 subunit, subfamily [Myxococcaceae bacterium]
MGSSVPGRASGNLRLVPSPAPHAQNSAAGPDHDPGRGRPVAPGPARDDSELLSALRAADPSAATALHDRVRPQVDRTITRLLGRRDPDHADLAQLAMIELVYTIDRYRGECSLDAWTSTLTARVVYKQIRKRQTERRILGTLDAEDYVARSAPSTDREAVARDLMLRVRKHLDEIEENKAWTFLLHDACGYDLQEIAQITGVSVAAAQARLVRGRREVHERIAADPDIAGHITLDERGEVLS